MIQIKPPKPTPQAGHSVPLWEVAFGDAFAEVIANSVDRRAFRPVQPQSLECCDASWHQPFAARFFLREAPTLKQFGRNAEPTELDRYGRTGQPSTRVKYVPHDQTSAPSIRPSQFHLHSPIKPH